MKKNLAFTLIIWFSFFGIFEIGLRSYEYIKEFRKGKSKYIFNPASIFVPHPFIAYAPNPDHPDHTAQGYRAEKNRLYGSDSNSINIVSLGGSSTYGTRVFQEDSYPYLLEKELSKYIDKTVNVINGGLGGYSTPNIISLLSLKIVHLNPEIIIFYVGFNDAWNRILYSDFKMDYSHAQKSWAMPDFPFWRNSRLLDVVADKLGYPFNRDPHIHLVAWQRRSGNPEINLHHSSVDAFRKNLMTLFGISRTHGSIPIIVTQATNFKNHPIKANNKEWMQAIEEHTKIIKQVASDMSVDLIDIRNFMTDKEEYFVDVLHMNEKGNRKRAEVIADYLIRNKLIGK